MLRKLGLTPQALRQQVTKVVGKGAEEGRVETPSNTPDLDQFSRDLTKLARDGKLDPVIGRAREIETTIEVLARRKKNNPVLIGEPGVGKTAIVEGLAQRIVAGEVPEALRDKRLVELNINSMVAGSKYRGEFEERVQKILKENGARHVAAIASGEAVNFAQAMPGELGPPDDDGEDDQMLAEDDADLSDAEPIAALPAPRPALSGEARDRLNAVLRDLLDCKRMLERARE
jgi:hypothetical protein